MAVQSLAPTAVQSHVPTSLPAFMTRSTAAKATAHDLFKPSPPVEPAAPTPPREPGALRAALGSLPGIGLGGALGVAAASLAVGWVGGAVAVGLALVPVVGATLLAGALSSLTRSEGIQALTAVATFVGGLVGAAVLGATGGWVLTLGACGALTGGLVSAMISAYRQDLQYQREMERYRPLEQKYRQDLQRYRDDLTTYEKRLAEWKAADAPTRAGVREEAEQVVVSGVVLKKHRPEPPSTGSAGVERHST